MLEIIVALILLVVATKVWKRLQRRRREQYIDDYPFHSGVFNKFREVRPGLTEAQEELVFAALRDYFHICNDSGRRMVAMPSQVVDDAWHAFILFTRAYQQFSKRAFGRFLHHTPAEAMKSPTLAGEGLKRAWRLACARDGVDPRNPRNLPLLFAIDAQLNIANGFYYVPNCEGEVERNYSRGGGGAYCGSHIGCASGCGGDSGGDSDGGDGGGLWWRLRRRLRKRKGGPVPPLKLARRLAGPPSR